MHVVACLRKSIVNLGKLIENFVLKSFTRSRQIRKIISPAQTETFHNFTLEISKIELWYSFEITRIYRCFQ